MLSCLWQPGIVQSEYDQPWQPSSVGYVHLQTRAPKYEEGRDIIKGGVMARLLFKVTL